MKIGELKKFIADNNLSDDIHINLWDLSTDDFTNGNYAIRKENLLIHEAVLHEGGDSIGKALFITFENCLNENPI